ncbi:hypothetical protein AZ027_002856, partial [Klebsiella pneumoniae]
ASSSKTGRASPGLGWAARAGPP